MFYRNFTIVIVLLLTLTASTAFSQQRIRDIKPTVILISLDGFRYDYLDRYQPPTLMSMAAHGVRAKWMIPSFPTKTFPNHYTIVTGLYPAHHGIVENNIYDFGVVFRMDKWEQVKDARWWLGEPIWVTAEKQGQHSAAYFWPGSEAPVHGIRPSTYRAYNGKVPNDLRVDELLATLDRPVATRPTILTLYFSDTDDTGHEFGPESEETRYAALAVDRCIARLLAGLKRRGVDNKVNVIVVSDHGMAAVDRRNVVIMDPALPTDMLERDPLTTGEIWQIFPKPGRSAAIMAGLRKLEHTTCWEKDAIPERLHYKDGERVAPIVCSADLGWVMSSQKMFDDDRQRQFFLQTHGAHGYDNRYQEMMATFIAHGPAFKKGFVAEPFPNVDVYDLMCRILGLDPAKNDGDPGRVRAMLR
jgi:predicted AlkP superfamily pyrophosphatase or phosphodiesterase